MSRNRVPEIIYLQPHARPEALGFIHWRKVAKDYLNISTSFYWRLRGEGQLAFATFSIKGKVYHREEEVKDWLEAGSPSRAKGWKWNKRIIPLNYFAHEEDCGLLQAGIAPDPAFVKGNAKCAVPQ